MSENLYFDKKTHTVSGKSFKIKSVGQKFNEPHFHIFFYLDDSICFYFGVIRDLVQDDKTSDTKIWDVKLLWCIDSSLIHHIEPISQELQQRAKSNILEGMHLMDDMFTGPADSVKMSAK